MSLSINTNNSAMVALESLNATTSSLDATENTVSTGQKVATAKDGPATYAIAQQMNGNIAGLSAVSDGLSFAASTLSTTASAVSNILSTLQLLQTAVTGLGDNQGDPTALTQTSDEINGYLDQINTFARNATVNGVNLLTTQSDSNNANGGTGTSGPVTASSMIYVTSLQGSTNTITNVTNGTAGVGSVIKTLVGTASSDTTTLTDVLGLSSKMTAGESFVGGSGTGINAFVSGTGTATSLSGTSLPALILIVQNAITAMTDAASTLATNAKVVDGMSSYSSNLSDSLTSGVGALTDADMAAESAKLTSLQTKQQLAISSLSVAKSSSQNILSLFR
ncbi:flagellin C [Acetobacter aceti NRIC 0242]|uniref:Flagellin n=1 Tax=Acetobacter aceti NBRC 14818 TaxID=887700 RepID=A0AB33IME3_ACEAC|nr:flagellin [Acetobacter aceti]TCS35058.1 flagellin [Acetobacter aceti NBRC 14818]BCK77656.1 flagellin [Acetobacter aceti NBRC 14818]GAN55872.1 flagellin C [Acetobacter aceti NBRC 14818]GBO80290.1 flagellin C [Acetobacter aceti NRIC 0242]